MGRGDVVGDETSPCVTTLLSEFLRLNNTDAVAFEVTLGTHGIDLDVADPHAAFCAGLVRSRAG